VLEALTGNGSSAPFVSFAHKLIDVNSRIPFGSFEESLAYFKRTGALSEQSQGYGILPTLIEGKSQNYSLLTVFPMNTRLGCATATPSSSSASGNRSTIPVLIPSNSMGLEKWRA
jgi:hypothetical protein